MRQCWCGALSPFTWRLPENSGKLHRRDCIGKEPVTHSKGTQRGMATVSQRSKAWIRCACLGLMPALLFDGPAAAETFEIKNPLIVKRADPDIYLHSDGYYYFTATVPA